MQTLTPEEAKELALDLVGSHTLYAGQLGRVIGWRRHDGSVVSIVDVEGTRHNVNPVMVLENIQ